MTIINNPQGAYGYDDLQTKGWYLPGGFRANGDIEPGQVVALNSDGTVSTAATNANPALCVGVALSGARSGMTTSVALKGFVENVPATGSIAGGAFVGRSTATAGAVAAVADPGVGAALGVAIAAAADGKVNIWVTG